MAHGGYWKGLVFFKMSSEVGLFQRELVGQWRLKGGFMVRDFLGEACPMVPPEYSFVSDCL